MKAFYKTCLVYGCLLFKWTKTLRHCSFEVFYNHANTACLRSDERAPQVSSAGPVVSWALSHLTEMNKQWNFTSGFTYTRAAIVWPHVHASLFEVAVNWKVRAKRQEAFHDTRPSCGHFRVRFTLTPTGLTDPQSWKEFLSGAHLNFTRPKCQPQKRAGWRGWVGCGMGWESLWESQGVVAKVELQKQLFVKGGYRDSFC